MENQWSKQEAFFACAAQVWLAVNTTPVYAIHEALNVCKNLKIHLRLALKM